MTTDRQAQLNRIFSGVRKLNAYSEKEIENLYKLFEVARKQRNHYRKILAIIANGEDPRYPGSSVSATYLRKLAEDALREEF